MANEAVLIERFRDPISLPVGDVAYTKGQFCELTDNKIASGSEIRIRRPCAGIAARDKVAGDGRNTLAFFQDGIFSALLSGAIGAGDALMMADSNLVIANTASADVSGAAIIGYAMEDATDDTQVTFKLKLN